MSRAFVSVLVSVSVAAALAPTPVGAHVKWFEDPTRYPIRTDLIVSGRTLLLVVVALVAPALFVPNMRLGADGVGLALGAIELFIAFSFITGLADWVGALALLLLGPVGFLLFPASD